MTTLTIELTHEEQRRVAAAERYGVDLPRLVHALITALPDDSTALPISTWQTATAPLQQDFDRNGWSEDELGALIDTEIAASRRTYADLPQ